MSEWKGCKCPNCKCRPDNIGVKVPVPPIANNEQLDLFMAHHFLIMLNDIHKEFSNIMTGKLTVEFQYNPALLRDELVMEWVPRHG